ncbi:hypothetical protein AB0K12_41900 [Nonomuraea sp. NPDC049419]|uniref:hypothetical protein n=1 Tax=Nonomuraea sp. NPDC049419 TaxID=3155772 RepID=UPI00342ABE58
MKTVVITGGTDGIGRALALTHVDRGDRVVVLGIDPATERRLRRGIRRALSLDEPEVRERRPGTVSTSFAGEFDAAEAAHIARSRATGKPVEVAVREILPFLDAGAHGRLVAVSEGRTVPLDPRASSPADARRLYEYTQKVLAERPRSKKNIEVPER